MATSTKIQHRKKETTSVIPPINCVIWEENDLWYKTKIKHIRYTIPLPGFHRHHYIVQTGRNLKISVRDISDDYDYLTKEQKGLVSETTPFKPFAGEINITLELNHEVIKTTYKNGMLEITTKYNDPEKTIQHNIEG